MDTLNFEPKWGSKPVTDRLHTIINFCLTEFGMHRKMRLSKNKLIEGFGQQNRVDKNSYLRNLILKKTAYEVRGQENAQWQISWANLLWACNQSGLAPQEVVNKTLAKEIQIKKKEDTSSLAQGSISVYTFSQDDRDAKDFFDLAKLQSEYTHLHT
jgi:hypothetical protein